MSFFDNLKNKMNIGGVSIELYAPDHAKKTDDFISGTFTMTTESEQYVKSISVKLVERRTTTRGRDRRTSTNTRTCGEYKISESFGAGAEWRDLSGGEIEIGGMKTDLLKAAGNLASIVSNEMINHYIKVVANVEGVWRNPAKSQRITLLR